jgi:alkylated DNA nucleotide flippase Atl1
MFEIGRIFRRIDEGERVMPYRLIGRRLRLSLSGAGEQQDRDRERARDESESA